MTNSTLLQALETLSDNPYDQEAISYISLYNPDLADSLQDAQMNEDEDEVIALCYEHRDL